MTAGERALLQSLTFADREHGWAVGGTDSGFGTALFHTDDGGQTWTDQLPNITGLAGGPPETFGFLGVAFTDASHGVAVGAEQQHVALFNPPALVVVTDDGGSSWRAAAISGPRPLGTLRSVCLNPNGTGIAVGNGFGGGGIVIATADGGVTWKEIGRQLGFYGGEDTTITAAACAEPSSFWISGTNFGHVGYHPTLLYSPSAGAAWLDHTPSVLSAARFLPLSFVNGSEGWTIPGEPPPSTEASTDFIEHTTNAGAGWRRFALPDGSGSAYHALAFLDRERGVAVGQDRTSSASSIATADAGSTWVAGVLPPGIGALVAVAIVP
jgi:photosystem II stability/assembly factor-like uncharacterized protein